MGVCSRCATHCFLTHDKGDASSSLVGSFFKIMIDERFFETLFIPPKIARSLTSLVNKKISIEDMKGVKWTVELSNVGCDLAFKHGWRAFSSANGLELGDFLVFHHISPTRFFVQILDRTGGEKMNFPSLTPSVPKKRGRTSSVSDDNDFSCSNDSGESASITHSSKETPPNACHSHDVPKKSGSASPDSDSGSQKEISPEAHQFDSTRDNKEEKQNFEDPCCRIIRDIDFTPEVDERPLFDLSEFEMCKKKPVCGINDHSTQDAGCSAGTERMTLLEKGPSIEESSAAVGSAMDVSYANENYEGRKVGSSNRREISEQNLPENRPLMNTVNAIDQKMKHMCSPPKFKAQTSTFGDQDPLCHKREVEKKIVNRDEMGPKQSQFGSSVKLPKRERKESNPGDIGEIARKIKKEHSEFNPEYFRKPKKEIRDSSPEHFGKEKSVSRGLEGSRASAPSPSPGTVKTEPSSVAEPPSQLSITCSVSSDNATYLELPTGLSSLASRRGKAGAEMKIVLLRDASGRLWPMFYHEDGVSRTHVLAHGWGSFRRANRIRNGAECVFELEDKSKDLYRVHVVHK